jgi:RNA 3'-terminal phosphate cyclase (GTP)
MQGKGDHLTIIDGLYGQGGGRISRTFLALSAIHQKPATLQHIRANRNNPRLRPQHLKGVEALAHVTGAKIKRARA